MSLHAINTAITYRQRDDQISFHWIAGSRNWLAILNQPGRVSGDFINWANGYDHIENPITTPFVIRMEEGHD